MIQNNKVIHKLYAMRITIADKYDGFVTAYVLSKVLKLNIQ